MEEFNNNTKLLISQKDLAMRPWPRAQNLRAKCSYVQETLKEHEVPKVPQWIQFAPRYKVAFCPVPKCGLSSLNRYQADMLSIPRESYDVFANDGISWELMETLTQLPKSSTDKQRLAFMKRFHKVIFVRHPFTRLVSAYQDKVLGHSWFVKDLLKFQSTTEVICRHLFYIS